MPYIAIVKTVKEGIGPVPGEINELVGYHNIAAFDLLSKAATGSGGKNILATQGFQSIDISAVVDMGGGDGMIAVVSRKNKHLTISDGSIKKRGTRRTKTGGDRELARIFKNVHFLKP